ncbi:hypothetical protein L1887_31039 [Cichorium endivia]|nr:hypothetical protein L1887_31039 [Cichorium endivia]
MVVHMDMLLGVMLKENVGCFVSRAGKRFSFQLYVDYECEVLLYLDLDLKYNEVNLVIGTTVILFKKFTDNMSNASAGPSSKAKTGSSHPSETSLKRKRGLFQKDLQHMMYGFGDDSNPLPETVALMEDIVMEYVTDMAHKAQDIASKRGKLLTEDFLFLIRNDLPKVNRCKELLSMNEELKQARKAFDVDEEKLAQKD